MDPTRLHQASVQHQFLLHVEPFFPTGEESLDLRYEYRHILLSIPSLSGHQAKLFMTRLLARYRGLDEATLAQICQVSPRTVKDWKAGVLRLKGETVALIFRHIHRLVHPSGNVSEDEYLLERAQWIQEVLAA